MRPTAQILDRAAGCMVGWLTERNFISQTITDDWKRMIKKISENEATTPIVFGSSVLGIGNFKQVHFRENVHGRIVRFPESDRARLRSGIKIINWHIPH